jgi:hypothetical protein
MPEFTWNETDLIECFGVVPEVEIHGLEHRFVVLREGLRLAVTVSQYDAEVVIQLCRDSGDDYILHTRLIDCPGIRLVRNKCGSDYLEFAAAKCFGDRYDGQSLIPFGIRITVDPDIRIVLF